MFFKPEFKDMLLNGTKIATIRKTKKVNVGTKFKIRLGTRFKSEYLCDAECLGVVKIYINESGYDGHDSTALYLCINGIYAYVDIIGLLRSLGFYSIHKARDFYKKSLGEDMQGYIHIFKIIPQEI